MNDGYPLDDWLGRLYECVRERGYDSLTAFADERPTMSLQMLARELHKEDISWRQVLDGLLDEAERHNQVTRLVRDQFVRLWAQWFPEGWPTVMAGDNHARLGEVFGRWTWYTPKTHKRRVRDAKDALVAARLPPGWRPLGPDDERLCSILPDENV